MDIRDYIRLALSEDVGDGDHTSLSTIPRDAERRARLLVKEDGIVAGVEVAKIIFEEVDPLLEVEVFIQDGQAIQKGDIVLHVAGDAQSILKAERLVLNTMQRMSGIATYTRSMVGLLEGLPTKLLDTRKTTPNFRIFEKMAVKIGGAVNHRYALYDMILIKDNHVDYAGGIEAAITKANEYIRKKQKNLQIEVEVRNLTELEEVLRVGNIHRIMLDNFSLTDLRSAVVRVNGLYPTEASGGIREDTIRAVAETGVDYISCGALTHQIKSLDLSLKAY
ncbi:MAG: carboxylating nicotinate-nucleotide diphosphorylase [Spirosomaceae bacterium]|jgi:nicotinate-nucleotide pyrophosphorylase (carboxylating)|nr:carboxylating nicotinate-nucleotide diphosphorylase [Spirosomataceae bacterium]